jgi:hypothetical protein
MIALWLALAIAAQPPEGRATRAYSANDTRDLEEIIGILKTHVAYVTFESKDADSGPLEAERHDAFGAVLDENKIVIHALFLSGAQKIRIEGPSGKSTEARIILSDPERRVAILESRRPLKELGFKPVTVSPKTSRKVDDEVFALTTTNEEAAVMHGVFVYVGDEVEYGGHSRIDLKLARGAPVFDSRLRLVGFARAVSWDKDRQMLITPEMISEARTATGAAKVSPAIDPSLKPWWSK